MAFSEKQKDYLLNANHRWNIKSGATRSGKTHVDYFVIPKRISKCTGSGHIFIIGNTLKTVERNVLSPMRNIWGMQLVPDIRQDGSVKLFGHQAYVFGADNKSRVSAIQGTGIEYCYGDEVTTWNRAVFEMLKSRLDKPNSRFDGTCNPDNPGHWFKEFIDSNADIYCQNYCIDDNPFLTPEFVSNLKKEYEGTVYYDRFIKGLWRPASGIIYRKFADNPAKYLITYNDYKIKEISRIIVGVDFGGTKSGTAFVATGIEKNYKGIVALKSERHFIELDPAQLGKIFVNFVKSVQITYGAVSIAYCDNAESILIRGLKNAVAKSGLSVRVTPAFKDEILNRIRLTAGLIAQDRFCYTESCESLKDAMKDALWVPDKVQDERLDDGTTDIDSLDAFEYTIELEARRLIEAGGTV